MKKTLLLIVALVTLTATTTFAQNYNWGVGASIGLTQNNSAAISLKHQFKRSTVFEGVLDLYGNGFVVTGLYERYIPLNLRENFNLYIGGGAHVGSTYNQFRLGVDFIAGVEYKIPGVPVAFSLDYRPTVSFVPSVDTNFGRLDFGLRIVF